MSTQTAGWIPEMTLGWRLQMSLGETKVQDMADQLGVNRTTIGRWMHDKGAPPRRAYLAQWALLTGVDIRWLETGIAPRPEPGRDEELPRLDSNQQPSDYLSLLAGGAAA